MLFGCVWPFDVQRRDLWRLRDALDASMNPQVYVTSKFKENLAYKYLAPHVPHRIVQSPPMTVMTLESYLSVPSSLPIAMA